MKHNTVILNQPFGVGDVLFCMSIANDFVYNGYRVVWPVESWISPIAKHFPWLTVIDKSMVNIDINRRDDYVTSGCRVVPLRFADSICKVPYTDCMKSKYMLFDKDWTTWKDKFDCQRDEVAEQAVYSEVCGLAKGEKYNLICDRFGSNGRFKVPITPVNGLRNVYMKMTTEYTLIDWLTVIENATEIHAVSSSNIYLFELFDMKAMEIHLYVRRPIENNHSYYNYILSKPNYKLHS